MIIVVYSETDAASISGNLGVSEYSYYFVLKKYLPILEEIGSVRYVREPASEVDPIYEEALQRGESAVFMSFSPPHRTALDIKCPTICVLAWEFSSIPDESWSDDPRDNWVKTLSNIGNVITISQYSSDVIKGQLGPSLNIATIPAPVTEDPVPVGPQDLYDGKSARTVKSLSVTAEVIDTSNLDISDDIVCFKSDLNIGSDLPVWDRQPLEMVFDGYTQENNGYRFLVGFHDPETWGAWSRSDRPWISLPISLEGDFTLDIHLVGFEVNDQRPITVTIGNQARSIKIDTELTEYKLEFKDVSGGSSIKFSDLETGYTLGAELLRALSLGVAKLAITDSNADSSGEPSSEEDIDRSSRVKGDTTNANTAIELYFDGVVYTSIFNPEDGRKNWEDIVTAFCWAFRDDPDKTLILKFTCPNMASSWGRLFLLFSQLNPFSCRIVVIHGYLTEDEMQSLVSVTDFFVNASKAEGQCLPLLEFMAEGVPAIAPCHTAMASYINDDNAFVVESSLVATCWPQDPREYDKTFFYRIDWSSLHQCYLQSAKIALEDEHKYRHMGFNAAKTVRENYSLSEVGDLLRNYLSGFDRK